MWRSVAAFAALDLVFKVVTISAESVLLGTPARLPIALAFPFLTAYLGSLAWLARPIAQWERSESRDPHAIARIARSIHRFPWIAAGMWSVVWVAFFASVFVLDHGQAPRSGKIAFLVAMAVGPLPLAHGLAVWLAAPVGRRVSLLARAEGATREATGHIGLHGRLALYALAIAIAPSAYMASIAFAIRGQSLTVDNVTAVVLLFFGGIAVFAIVAAILLAVTITRPVADMAGIMRVITRQGDVRRVGRVPIGELDEVGDLAELTNTMLDRLEVVAQGQATATESLAALNQNLERRIEERTAELQVRNADMRLVLDNVTQALFAIDRTGAISAERSSILERWFGPVAPGDTFHAYLGRRSTSFGDRARFGWEQVTDGFLPFELTLDQLPTTLDADGRHYRITYDRIGHREELRILVVVSDITSELDHAVMVREKTETFALLDHALSDRAGFIAFLHEVTTRIDGLATDDLVTARRAIHTVKGSSALFGLESVAAICHELESTIDERHETPTATDLEPLRARWTRLTEVAGLLLGDRGASITISPSQHHALDRAIRSGASPRVLARMLHALTLDPVESRLARLADQGRRIARAMGKDVEVSVEHDGLRVDGARWASFWAALGHAVRNAVDHGIEDAGRLRFVARRDRDRIVVALHDDGRGIQWDRIRERALALGLPAETPRDLTLALFTDGLSTADQVTETSGRGVGMAALRDAVVELGGTIDLASAPGTGTSITMTFPSIAAAPDFEDIATAA